MLIIKRIEELTPVEMTWLKDVIRDYGRYMFEELGLVAGKESFYSELDAFPGNNYMPPDGIFFLALYDGQPAGCIGLRRYSETACEMKRMYVLPAYRGLGIASKLCSVFLEWAGQLCYEKVLLDTNREMAEAVSIYHKLGFVPIPPYCRNDNPNPLYFMKVLQPHSY
jgi:carbonic anhydrase